MSKLCVICRFSSWHHLFSICSYFKAVEVRPHYIIVIESDFFDKKIDYDRSYLNRFCNQLIFCKSIGELSGCLGLPVLRRCKVKIVSPTERPIGISLYLMKRLVRHEIVAVDEGLGSYESFMSGVIAKGRVMYITQKLYPRFLVLAFYFSVSALSVMYFKFLKIERWYFVDPWNLDSNQEVVECYRSVLRDLVFETKPDAEFSLGGVEANAVLFVSSPFVELGLINKEKYVDLTRKLASWCGECEIYVKPHPIEDCSKFSGFKIVNSREPIELWMERNLEGGLRVVSFSSTAIYTLRTLYGVTLWRLSDGDQFYPNLSSLQRKIVDRFSKPLHLQ